MHGLQVAGNRTLVAGDYLLEYAYDGTMIDIVGVRHGRIAVPMPDIDMDDDLGDDIGDRSDTKPKP